MHNLYIHVPFCSVKCAYCAFYSIPGHHPGLMEQWLRKTEQTLAEQTDHLQNLKTLYIGGGTPGYLPDPLFQHLMESVQRFCSFVQDAEKTAECNPEWITESKAQLFARYLNRISMGVQSFSKKTLASLGRFTGPPEKAEQAVRLLRNAGLQNIGLDLISGAPGQTLDEWRSDLLHACSLHPDHISAYSLIVEDGTPFQRNNPEYIPDDELSASAWDAADEILGNHGLPRYEVSNYASAAKEARHNQNVWHGDSYLGIGPSASSFDGQLRWTEQADLTKWLKGTPPDPDPLPVPERAAEILIMGLRTVRGWNREEFEAVSGGVRLSSFRKKIEPYLAENMAVFTDDALYLTKHGLAFWNDIAEALL